MKYDISLDIATASSARAAKWKNKRILWSEVVAQLTSTERTKETVKQYFSYTKDRQDEIKDVGGFVGGKLLGGTNKIKGVDVTFKPPYGWRRRGFVESRQLVALDVDFGNLDVWIDFGLLEYAGLLYTTHKHRPESPRFRIVFPLDRPVTPDEYECIAHVVASWLDIEVFDDTTYQATRLMYYPSSPKDGEFISHVSDGPIMCADKVLAELEDWTDVTSWPASSREKEVRRSATSDKVEDPEVKVGIIGAFCRAYSLDEAIAEFLPEVYAPCEELGEDRYSYLPGSTSGGLIVYDHKLAYSHHNTDPAGGKLCNAFDLVRLHKFADLDEHVKEGADITKTPSFKAMSAFAAELKLVKKEIVRERRESSASDYDVAEEKAVKAATKDEWVGDLETEGKSGKIKSTISNIVTILNNDANLQGRFGYNEFEQRETAIKVLPWDKVGLKYPRPLRDSDDAELRLYFERCYDIAGKENIADGLTVALRGNSYHPIKNYLDSLEWDNEERLDDLFIRIFGAEDTSYTRAITRKAFTAAVARIYKPGTKFDYILVIIGDQGVGKSSTLKAMGGDWFSDSVTQLTGNAAIESIQGAWLIELGELAGLRRAEVEAVKHFVSKTEDRYRVAYGRRIEYFPRRCVFFGTTNEEDFLRDVTGNRRFWVLNCKNKKGAEPFYEYMSPSIVAQLWAEAKSRYIDGERLYLEEELECEARAIQDKHMEKDERSGLILEYLKRKLPNNWGAMEPYSRRNWIREEENDGAEERKYVCILEIWTECLGKSPEDITRRDSMDIGRVMKTLRDWTPAPPMRVKFYGLQKMYIRKLLPRK